MGRGIIGIPVRKDQGGKARGVGQGGRPGGLIFVFTLILSFAVLPPCVTLAYMYLSNDIRYTVLLMLICMICKYCKV